MRTPRVVPHANKSFVSTSTRSIGRKSAKAMKSHTAAASKNDGFGLGVIVTFGIGFIADLLLQAGVIS